MHVGADQQDMPPRALAFAVRTPRHSGSRHLDAPLTHVHDLIFVEDRMF